MSDEKREMKADGTPPRDADGNTSSGGAPQGAGTGSPHGRLPIDNRDWTPPKHSVTAQLGLVKFKPDEDAHLSVKDKSVCRDTCRRKFCTHTCPAQVYRWEEEEKTITIAFEGCLECGTCRSGGCPYDNIEMSYPRGGFGLQYRFG